MSSRGTAADATDLVAIVGSAGAVGAMESLLGALPRNLPAAVLIVLHLMQQRSSVLPQILDRSTDLRVEQATDGAALEEGTVYVAPPDSHMLVGEDGRLHLDRSALVHHVRPSADALLLSMARGGGCRQIVVVLSGTGIDGAAGAAAVKQAGGTVLAQDEATSQFFGMPGAAIMAGGVDRVLPLREIAPAVLEWALTPA